MLRALGSDPFANSSTLRRSTTCGLRALMSCVACSVDSVGPLARASHQRPDEHGPADERNGDEDDVVEEELHSGVDLGWRAVRGPAVKAEKLTIIE